ncbi:uncharacterized protein LOC129318064 isoform X2 [Prosopis cineraria]|uniref:uncharacterized protein LOC129318064 isoform X2 n=1 Tax=Prosopis cineraria TaxID=364024 RepID=UPI00240EFDB0|nr:uncharacterized protein LOC129318064 isoform X2 [Prosopis cineraria]
MMERLSGGGRQKADNRWEHVTKLTEEKNQTLVECRYCGLQFKTAGSSRIESHIFGPKKGHKKAIRLCTGFSGLNNTGSNKVTADLNEKEDLLDSQGLSTLDRTRDYNKPNETLMLDCYVSPKTMWEGIKAFQQVQCHTKAMNQERIKVGPFYVSNMVNDRDSQLIEYVFEHASKICIVFSSSRSFLNQSQFTSLGPRAYLDSSVIDTFADILTYIERKKSKHLNWYLPVTFSNVALSSGDVSSFVDFVERQKMKENYMSDFINNCEKIFIPVRVEKNSCGHFYLYIIDVKNQVVEIWDSLCPQFMDKSTREQTTKLLFAMENIFGNVKFTEFSWGMASNILSQTNGLTVIKKDWIWL